MYRAVRAIQFAELGIGTLRSQKNRRMILSPENDVNIQMARSSCPQVSGRMSADYNVPRRPRHLTLFVAGGLILGLVAISGIIYSGAGSLTFGPSGALVLGGALAVSVLVMILGITIILVRYR